MNEAVESTNPDEATPTSSPRREKNQKPEKVIRRGAVAASIWKRQSTSGYVYFDFSVSRAWKSRNGAKQGYSPNFFHYNAGSLLEVVSEAAAWIEQQQTGDSAGIVNGDGAIES